MAGPCVTPRYVKARGDHRDDRSCPERTASGGRTRHPRDKGGRQLDFEEPEHRQRKDDEDRADHAKQELVPQE